MKIAGIMAVLLLGIAVTTGGCIREPDERPAEEYVQQGDAIPAFDVTTQYGDTFRTPDDCIGHITTVVFFATWCPNCQAELPELERLYRKIEDDDRYRLITIARGGKGDYAQTETIVGEYWDTRNYTMPYALDPDRKIFEKFASANIPRVYMIDCEGIVFRREVAPQMTAEEYIGIMEQAYSATKH